MKAAIVIDLDEKYFEKPSLIYANVKVTYDEDVVAIFPVERLIPLPARKDTNIDNQTQFIYRSGFNKCLDWLGVEK